MTEMPRNQTAPLGVPEFDLADRLRKALRESKVGVQEMADYLEVARETVSTWINGRIPPSPQSIRLFALRTGVDYQWLRTGSVPGPNDPNQGEPPLNTRPKGPKTGYRMRWSHSLIRRQKRPEIVPGAVPHLVPLRPAA